MASNNPPTGLFAPHIQGVLFDLDGVLTPTAVIHRRAWAQLFTTYFEAHSVDPPYTEQDYYTYIDGKPRFNGVADLLTGRGIALPLGQVDDPPGWDTVAALGNSKNQTFNEILAAEPMEPYLGVVDLLDSLEQHGIQMAVVSSSANARLVLDSAGLLSRFGVVVDAAVATAQRLAGKPAPDTFQFGANQLGLRPAACAVVEDAVAGVAAGQAGGFGLVVGVDRGTGAAALEAAGAGMVVSEMTELLP